MVADNPTVQELLASNDRDKLLGLFQFSPDMGALVITFKFNLWARKLHPKYFKSADMGRHSEIDYNNCLVFLGLADSYTDAAFRGAAKTTRTKLFFAFWIENDVTHSRRYLKILAEDDTNSKQSVTDIYNMLVDPMAVWLYPEIFAKTDHKREETMESFTTSTGIKLLADTVGSAQRGALQEEARPDVVWFDDFETRNTLKSPIKTKSIWDNMVEAMDGLAKGGGFIATCNYLSERGNVHKLVERAGGVDFGTGLSASQSERRDKLSIIPICDKAGNPTWSARYTVAEVESILAKAEDPEGEYLQNPSAGKDILFDRASVDKQERLVPIKEVAGFKMFKLYDPSHRYGAGHDVAGGVGLDSSTSVFIDFDTIPAQVAGTYKNNEILPDIFGDEVARQGERYGECLLAPESNNHGHATIGRLKQIYPLEKIHKMQRDPAKVKPGMPVEYGWNTNSLTKSKMLAAFSKAVENGLVALNDPDLIAEARSYTRNDLMDGEVDPRLTTRHYDLLMAACIAWQLKDFAVVSKPKDDKKDEYVPEKPRYPGIGV